MDKLIEIEQSFRMFGFMSFIVMIASVMIYFIVLHYKSTARLAYIMFKVRCSRSAAIKIISYWHELNDYSTRYVSLYDCINVLTEFNKQGKKASDVGKELSEIIKNLSNKDSELTKAVGYQVKTKDDLINAFETLKTKQNKEYFSGC